MHAKRSVFISGGGPSGLAAALLFDQLGWDEIVVVERRKSPQDFEKNKSFNYLVEARGQKLLDRLGIRDRLDRYGVATRGFTATTLKPSGEAETKTFPIVDPERPVCYWTTRRALLTLLAEAIGERQSGRINLLYDHAVCGIERPASGRAAVTVSAPDGTIRRFTPDLILACDGLNSVIRDAVAAQDEVPEDHFSMVKATSISTGLRYKVLNLPAVFESADGKVRIDDSRMSYIIPSRHKGRRKACALFAFPVVSETDPRSVNLIREADHELWTIDDAHQLLEFLADSFPQLDITKLVPIQEAEDFVKLEPGSFPEAQYARNLHARFGNPGSETHCVLVGDAAHAFPPDLGLGVNAALQDLTVLGSNLDRSETLEEAVTNYAEERFPESRDLVWIVEKTFPEQYNHRPWRLKAWALGFFARKVLHAIAPWAFDKPAFYLSQEPEMSFGEMKRRKQRTDLRVRALGIGLLGLFGYMAAQAL